MGEPNGGETTTAREADPMPHDHPDSNPSENPYESAKTNPAVRAARPPLSFLPWFIGALVVAAGLFGLLVAMIAPSHRGAPEADCRSQMKQIMLAMHNYADQHGAFPPAYTVDAEGAPLHSWRTLLLPYLEEKALYDSIDLTKPWDDPVNQHARETVLDFYMCPSATHDYGPTTYVVVTGPGFLFDADKQATFDDIADGLSSTLAVVDVASEHAVEWMAPVDIDEQTLLDQLANGRLQHARVVMAGFADGRAKAISTSLPPEVCRAMLTIAGGEKLED